MKKVVVIGGGFAGSYIAKKLEDKFDVYLIDTKDYFEFTPALLRVIIEPKHTKKIQILHSKLLKKAKIIVGRADEVTRNFVKIRKRKIPFDYLIICSGSSYSNPIKNKDVVLVDRTNRLRKYHSLLEKSKNVLIVGGGLVGIELAAEICTKYKDKNITLVHSRERLIIRNNPKSSEYSYIFLTKRGIKIIFNDRVVSSRGDLFFTTNGMKIKADFVCFCTGIKPNSDFMRKHFSYLLDKNGQIKVNEHLQVFGKENIFAVGDVNSVDEEKTAQNADKQAKIVVKNLMALESGEKLNKYEIKKRYIVASLGKYDGIMEYGNFVLGGKTAALMKWLIEKCYMNGLL